MNHLFILLLSALRFIGIASPETQPRIWIECHQVGPNDMRCDGGN